MGADRPEPEEVQARFLSKGEDDLFSAVLRVTDPHPGYESCSSAHPEADIACIPPNRHVRSGRA